MSTPSQSTIPLEQYSKFQFAQQIQPAIIPEKKRPRVAQVSNAGFPYYPNRQVLLPGTPTTIELEVLSRQILIQNNSGAILYKKYAGDVSPVSVHIAPGQTVTDTVRSSVLYLYSVAGTIVNPFQSDGDGVVVEVYP